MPERDAATAGLLPALGAYLVWGLSPVYFKALSGVPPIEILCHRVAWSVALLAAAVALAGGFAELRRALGSRRARLTLGATTVLISGNWLLYIWAVNSGHLLEASLGYFVNPLVNVLLGVVFLRESLSRAQGLAVALAGAGVLWMVLSYGRFPWISLTLATTFGLYGLLRKSAGVGALSGLFCETALLAPAALLYLGLAAGAGSGAFGSGWRISLLLAAAGAITAVPLVWFAVAVRRLRLSTMGFLQYLAPSLQFALAVWLYREPFTRSHLTTFGFIWTSLGLYTWDAVRRLGSVEPPSVATASRPSSRAGTRPAAARGRSGPPPRR
ncbi:MAG TPA: EamA family transporter RarD [Anaeromyxobacteraceae bacterium]|nr:EamA family transporter RarD [Anaeromyxobacteraceae bacterium]